MDGEGASAPDRDRVGRELAGVSGTAGCSARARSPFRHAFTAMSTSG